MSGPDETAGIAILTKTPGLSFVKTRLEKSIGRSRAEAFHNLSALATEETVVIASRLVPGVFPYWSVAEDEGEVHPHWRNLNRIFQGGGKFGSRLFQTYDQLLKRHHLSIFLVSDVPQISVDILLSAVRILSGSEGARRFVLGPSPDGGFYLFGEGAFYLRGFGTICPTAVRKPLPY